MKTERGLEETQGEEMEKRRERNKRETRDERAENRRKAHEG